MLCVLGPEPFYLVVFLPSRPCCSRSSQDSRRQGTFISFPIRDRVEICMFCRRSKSATSQCAVWELFRPRPAAPSIVVNLSLLTDFPQGRITKHRDITLSESVTVLHLVSHRPAALASNACVSASVPLFSFRLYFSRVESFPFHHPLGLGRLIVRSRICAILINLLFFFPSLFFSSLPLVQAVST